MVNKVNFHKKSLSYNLVGFKKDELIWTKQNQFDFSSTYICTKSMSFSLVFMKRVVSIFPILKPSFKRNLLNLSYHALGACFKP